MATLVETQPFPAAMTGEPELKVEGVSFHRGGREILGGLQLEVKTGEFMVFMGPSGCGKTTFLRLVAGLEPPSAGAIRIQGRVLNGPSPERCIVFQDYSLFPWLTAVDNLVIALRQRFPRRKRKELKDLAEQYLDVVQLPRAGNLYPGQLSGGMRQRIAIARALAIAPEILLMDEPFGALDPLTRAHLQDLLLNLVRDRALTVLLVTHDVDEALYLADRVVVFSPGPPARICEIVDVPFAKPRSRKTMAERPEYHRIRDRILTLMNQELLTRLGQDGLVEPSGDVI